MDAVSITSLPAELLVQIFYYLGPIHSAATTSLVCKAWYQVSQDQPLWQRFYRDRYRRTPPPAQRLHPKIAFAQAHNWIRRLHAGDWVRHSLPSQNATLSVWSEERPFLAYRVLWMPRSGGWISVTASRKQGWIKWDKFCWQLLYQDNHNKSSTVLFTAEHNKGPLRIAPCHRNAHDTVFLAATRTGQIWLFQAKRKKQKPLDAWHPPGQTVHYPWLLKLQRDCFVLVEQIHSLVLYRISAEHKFCRQASYQYHYPGGPVQQVIACSWGGENFLVVVDETLRVFGFQLDRTHKIPLWDQSILAASDDQTCALWKVPGKTGERFAAYNLYKNLCLINPATGKQIVVMDRSLSRGRPAPRIVQSKEGKSYLLALSAGRMVAWDACTGSKVWSSVHQLTPLGVRPAIVRLVVIQGPENPYAIIVQRKMKTFYTRRNLVEWRCEDHFVVLRLFPKRVHSQSTLQPTEVCRFLAHWKKKEACAGMLRTLRAPSGFDAVFQLQSSLSLWRFDERQNPDNRRVLTLIKRFAREIEHLMGDWCRR